MEKQTIVIEYVGEQPTPEAVRAAFSTLLRAGTFVDANVQPNITHLTEHEVLSAAAVLATKTSGKKGITVKISDPLVPDGLDRDKAIKFIDALKSIING